MFPFCIFILGLQFFFISIVIVFCRIHGALYICYNRLCTNLDKIDMTVSYIKNGLAKPDFGQAKPNICIYGNPVELFVPFAPQYSTILAQNKGY